MMQPYVGPILILAMLHSAGQTNIAAEPSRADRVWIGPSPFIQTEHKPGSFSRAIRSDFVPILTNSQSWPYVLERTDIFKSYLMLLPTGPLPGESEPELNDAELKRLVDFIKEHDLRVAFETGGLRIGETLKGREDQAGEWQAQSELQHLRRWLDAGGSIDYLTTDHAVMMNMRGLGFPGPGLDPNRSRKLTTAKLTDELVDYFLVMQREIPGVRFGVIESLGYFHVKGVDGYQYKSTDPYLPQWNFEQFFDHLLARMAEHDIKLDHFHIDFAYVGAVHDGRLLKKDLDYGRILAVERHVQSRGVKAGIIFNAFHDRTDKHLTEQTANRQARDRTIAFAEGYQKAGGKAEHVVIQTWHPYPNRTGPETDPLTVLGVARDVLKTTNNSGVAEVE